MITVMMVRWLPLAGLAALLVLGVGFRVLLQRLRFGSWGVRLFTDRRPAQLARDAGLVALVTALLVQALGIAMDPGPWLRMPFCPPWIAAAVTGLGLALIVVSQLQLGASWRIGIEPSARPGLVTRGLYRWSRNPIFVGLFLVFLGHAAAAPTALSRLGLLGLAGGIRLQVLEEERWLRAAYGRAFEEYASRVGRFLPGLGRLALDHPPGGGSGVSSGGGGASSSRIST